MSVEVFVLAAGLRGESLHPQHLEWIEVLDYTCSSVPLGELAPGEGFRPTLQLTKTVDSTSPIWELWYDTGRPTPTMRLEVCGGDGAQIVLTSCELTGVEVREYFRPEPDPGRTALEYLVLSYDSIEWTYHHAWSATPLIGVPLGRRLERGPNAPPVGPPAPDPVAPAAAAAPVRPQENAPDG